MGYLKLVKRVDFKRSSQEKKKNKNVFSFLYLSGWPKSSFEVFPSDVRINPNELFGRPNIRDDGCS